MSKPPMVTAVVMPARGDQQLREPIMVSAEQNAAELNLRDELIAESRLGGVDLCIRLCEGMLVISGTIESDDQRVLILDIAGRYAGSGKLVDEMEIADQSPDFCEA